MRLLVVFLCLLVGLAGAAPKKTDAQINEQRNALKKLESDLAKKREELVLLETEEKGVLNTISLLDQNLNQTRVYITELSKNERLVQQAVEQLKRDIDSLDNKIHVRKEAMKVRIRKLYVNGRYSEAEVLYRLLSREGNPRRQAYWVHHVLNEDRVQVETLTAMVTERDEKKREAEEHLVELNGLREKKAREEKGLVSQMSNQEQMLMSLKHDKAMQQRALQEFERNQKVMQALIAKLEAKRRIVGGSRIFLDDAGDQVLLLFGSRGVVNACRELLNSLTSTHVLHQVARFGGVPDVPTGKNILRHAI